MTRPSSFWRQQSAATAAEFALVLPVALLLLFGVIDGGRYLWAMNRLEKAVQMGSRSAVVTSIVADGMNSINYVGSTCPVYDASGTPTGGTTPIKAGDTICKEAVSATTCTKPNGTVTCKNAQGGTVTADAASFDRIATRMRVSDPFIPDSAVTVKYSGSGIGYAQDPVTSGGKALSDAALIVTVSINSLPLRTLFLLGGTIWLPGFSYSQTLEDGDGTVSY